MSNIVITTVNQAQGCFVYQLLLFCIFKNTCNINCNINSSSLLYEHENTMLLSKKEMCACVYVYYPNLKIAFLALT